MGDSIRSAQVTSFDTDDNQSYASWKLGMPWLKINGTPKAALESPRSPTDTNSKPPRHKGFFKNNHKTAQESNHNRYYGGVMKSSSNDHDKRQQHPKSSSSTTATAPQHPHHPIAVAHRTRSQDSLADFDESEWTPQDSSYGAACPVCGSVPKHVRRAVEFSMISLLVLAFIYFLVMTSINVSVARSSGKVVADGSSDANQKNATNVNRNGYNVDQSATLTDDNMYVEYNADATAEDGDDQVATDDNLNDAYWKNDDYSDDYNNVNKNNDDAYRTNNNYYYNNNNNNNGGGNNYYNNYNNNGGGRHHRERIRQ
jgi:hypothetical protein